MNEGIGTSSIMACGLPGKVSGARRSHNVDFYQEIIIKGKGALRGLIGPKYNQKLITEC